MVRIGFGDSSTSAVLRSAQLFSDFVFVRSRSFTSTIYIKLTSDTVGLTFCHRGAPGLWSRLTQLENAMMEYNTVPSQSNPAIQNKLRISIGLEWCWVWAISARCDEVEGWREGVWICKEKESSLSLWLHSLEDQTAFEMHHVMEAATVYIGKSVYF